MDDRRMLLSIWYQMVRWLLGLAVVLVRRDLSKDAELLVLCHENAVLRRQITRVHYTPADRMWLTVLSRLLPRRRWAEIVPVTPATILAWHRKLISRKWDYTVRRRPGRPPTVAAIKQLIIHMATENPTRGHRRVQGELVASATAGLDQELRACLHHPGWLLGKLEQLGPAGLEADLGLSDDLRSKALGTAVRQNAHLLGPLDPSGSLAATLATRLPHDGPTKAIAEDLVSELTVPHLRAITALPDLPRPAQSRMLTGHTSGVRQLVVAPDGSWLASGGFGGEVLVWDPAAGIVRHTLLGTLAGCGRWVSPRMGPGWPPSVTAGTSGFGIRSPAPSVTFSLATPAGCGRWV
jgi:hypothetical protein